MFSKFIISHVSSVFIYPVTLKVCNFSVNSPN